MNKYSFLLILVLFCLIPLRTHAEGFNVTKMVCGGYSYEVTRIVDGFFVKAEDTERSRTRTIFYPSTFRTKSVYPRGTHLISGCYRNGIVFKEYSMGKYGDMTIFRYIDPDQRELRIVTLSQVNNSMYPEPHVTFNPPESESEITELLLRPLVGWTIDRTGFVSKQRIAPEPADALNDRSYYILNASGGMVRKTSSSNWNQTEAKSAMVCQGVSYVLYAKKFYDPVDRTTKNPEPPVQFIIERSGDGRRTLIPIAVKQNDWNESRSYGYYVDSPRLGDCYGSHLALHIYGANNYATIITESTREVNVMDLSRGVNGLVSQMSNGSLYQMGDIERNVQGEISGSSMIRILNPDGTITDRKPVYFKSMLDNPDILGLRFVLDKQDSNRVIVLQYRLSDGDRYFLEENGSYREIPKSSQSLSYIYGNLEQQGTPLYLTVDANGVSVSSFFLEKPMLLNAYPGKRTQVIWSRIGPLELDGTRKIWYGISVNGRVETWLARVR